MEVLQTTVSQLHNQIRQVQVALKPFKSKKQPLSRFRRKLLSIQKKLDSIDYHNLQATLKLLEHLGIYLRHFLATVQEWRGSYNSVTADELHIMAGRAHAFAHYLKIMPSVPENDLFFLPRTHERWTRLRSCMSVQHAKDPAGLRAKFDTFILTVATTEATICRTFRAKNSWLRKLLVGWATVYYSLNPVTALRKALVYNAKPPRHLAEIITQVSSGPFVLKYLETVMEPIMYNSVIHLPQSAPHIFSEGEHEKPKPSLKEPTENSVQVRVLSNFPLPATGHSVDSVIFHAHGGGFMSMSSATHQPCTRKWVNALGIPCISVDYRLAPAHPFPSALDDIWQAYNWMLACAEEELGIVPRKIYLAGDSAGGNLVLGLAYKLIEAGLPLPTALLLQYPALNMSLNQFSESMILSLEDLLVPFGYFDIYLKAYIQDPTYDLDTNYYISPCKAPDEVIRQLPPVRMFVGDQDPLHDETLMYTERLLELGVDVHLKIYEEFIHGAISLCYEGGIEESIQMVDQVIQWVREFEHAGG